ncbi:radical SAM protein [Thermococcus sp.]
MLTNKDGVLIYNSITGAFAKLTLEEYRKYLSLNLNEDENNSLLENLKKGMFVVPADFNELEYIKERYTTLKHSATTLGLVIAPTLKCNLACIYCYQNRGEFDNSLLMPSNVQEALVSFMRNIIRDNTKLLSVLWYGGEPLMGLQVIRELTKKFLKIANELDIRYTASMITNGTLITPTIAEELHKLEIKAFQITLDGDKDTHNRKRIYKNGKGTFNRIIDAIKTLAKYRDTNITIRVNVDEEVAKNIDNILDTLDKEGLKNKIGIYFSKLEEYEYSSRAWACYIKSLEEYSKVEKKLYMRLIERGFKLNIYPFPRYIPCGAVREYGNICIDPEGYIYKCWHEIGVKEKSVGHVNEGFNERLNRWISYTPFSFEQCSTCKLLPVCMGGCPLRAMEGNRECMPLAQNIQEYLKLVYAYKSQQHTINKLKSIKEE